MAEVNKVEYAGEVLIDLTQDTATEDDVLEGVSFHSADGVSRVGRINVGSTSTSTSVLTKSADGNIRSLHMYGSSHKSKNLIDISNRAINSTSFVNKEAIDIPSGSYILSFDLGTSVSVAWAIRDASENVIASESATTTTHKEKEFTISASAKYLTIYTTSTSNVELSNVMIRLASVTDNTYEPYGIIKPSGVVESSSKNLLNSTLATTTVNGITCINNGDGTYTLNGTASANTSFYLTDNFNLSENVYHIVCHSGNYSSTRTLQLYKVDWSLVIGENNNDELIGGTCRVRLYCGSGQVYNNEIIKPMITTDTSATYNDYVPYGHSSITLPYEMLSVGNIKNELIVNADGSGKFVKRVDKVDLGSLNWSYQSGNSRFISVNISDIKYAPSGRFSDWLLSEKYTSSVGGSDKTIFGTKNGTNASTDIYIYDSEYTDANLFKTSLSGKYLYYEKSTLIEITLTKSQVNDILSLNTFVDTTYIDADGCPYEIGYFLDTNIGQGVADVDVKVDDVVGRVNYAYDNGFVGKNLFNKNNTENGYLDNNGNLVSNAGFKVSDYINVCNSSKMTISGNSGSSENICFYDSDKTFISRVGTSTNTTLTFDVPSNSKYIRVTIKTSQVDVYQLEFGEVATSYEPYAKSNVELTADVSTIPTEAEKNTWNAKQNAITSSNKLSYSLLSDTPSIPDTSKLYSTNDTASTSVADSDYVPISDASGNRKKALWTTLRDKFWTYVSSQLSTVATSGSYNDLSNKPTIPSYGVVSKTANGLAPQLPNETSTTKYLRQDGTWVVPPTGSGGTSDYTQLSNKPSINNVELSGNKSLSDLGINIPTRLSELIADQTHRTVTDAEKSTWDGKQNAITSNNKLSYSLLSDTPTIPTRLSELIADQTHRLVTDTEKTTWNNKASFSQIKDIDESTIGGTRFNWTSGTSYTEGTIVDGLRTTYLCIQDHVASSDNKPFDGSEWRTYWRTISNKALSNELNKSNSIDFKTQLSSAWSGNTITVNNAYFEQHGHMCFVMVQFRCSNDITSGNVPLGLPVPFGGKEFGSALVSRDGKCGFISINSSGALVIRCSASSSQWLIGSICYYVDSIP